MDRRRDTGTHLQGAEEEYQRNVWIEKPWAEIGMECFQEMLKERPWVAKEWEETQMKGVDLMKCRS